MVLGGGDPDMVQQVRPLPGAPAVAQQEDTAKQPVQRVLRVDLLCKGKG